jgi:LemA protein
MKKLFTAILVVVAAMSLSSCSYNSMVQMDENVKGKWGTVQTMYQRRSDLIPNLVEAVKGAANFEKSTLTAVIEARAKATAIQVDPSKLTPESIKAFQAAQGQLGAALGRLMVGLQAQIEGTENRISVARNDFNTAVQEYNTKIRSFPANITAKMFSFTEKGYFQAEAGADKAPKVKF